MGKELLRKPVDQLYKSYLMPTLLGVLSNSLYCLVDVYFIAKGSGDLGLAALNIAMPLYTIYSCIGLIFAVGASTQMAIAYGKQDDTMRNKAFTMCMVALLGIGIVLTILGSVFLEPLALLLGSSEQLLPYVLEYMRPIQLACFAFILMYATPLLLRSDHNPKCAMQSMIAGNFANIILDYVLVMVIPLGIQGAAIATAISPCICILYASLHFFQKKATVRLVKSWRDRAMFLSIVQNGLGSGIMELSAGIVIFLFNAVILKISTAQMLAAFAIISNIAYVCKGLFNGFAQAAQPIISSNYGARQMERVKAAKDISLRYTSLFALGVYVLFLLFPKAVSMPFVNGDLSLLESSATGVRYYFSCLFFMAINMMYMYYYQAVEQGNKATYISLLRGVVFVLIGLVVLVPFFAMNGVWFCAAFAEIMTLLVVWIQKKKQKKLSI